MSLVVESVFAQNTSTPDSSAKPSSPLEDSVQKVKNELEKVQDTIRELWSQINADKIGDTVAQIKLARDSITIYQNDTKVDTSKIDFVKITQEFGQINIIASVGGMLFKNQIPLPVSKFPSSSKKASYKKKGSPNIKGDAKLIQASGHVEDPTKLKWIWVSDLLLYEQFECYTPDPFEAKTLTYHSDTKSSDTILLTKTGITDNLVELRIYSDILALIGDESNGLIQSEINPRFTINTRAITKTGVIPLYNLSFPITLRKFDSKFGKFYFQDSIHYSRLEYVQQATYTAGLDFNAFKLGAQPFSTAQLFVDFNLGSGGFKTYSINKKQLVDSSGNSVTSADTVFRKYVNYEELGPSVSMFIKMSNKVALLAWGQLMWNWIADDLITDNSVLSYFEIGGRISIALKNSTSYYGTPKVFIRWIYYTGITSRESFSQLQVGYTTTLNNFFKK